MGSRVRIATLLLLVCGPFIAAQAQPPPPPVDGGAINGIAENPQLPWRLGRLEIPGIANALRVSDTVLSGGEPTSAASFASLKKLGVSTILSVDGLPPNVEAAAKHGLDYVHIPVAYREVSASAQAKLKALLDQTDGKLFVHCHHGKHRGPATAAILAALNREISAEDALDLLRVAGTSQRYSGLWRSVTEFDATKVVAWDCSLPSRVELKSIATAMAGIARDFEQLEIGLRSNGEKSENAIVDSAVQLDESFRELARRPNLDRDLRQNYIEIADRFASLSLDFSRQAETSTNKTKLLKAIQQRCDACHVEKRN